MRLKILKDIIDCLGYVKNQYTSRQYHISNTNHDSDHWVISKGLKSWVIRGSQQMITSMYPPDKGQTI